MNTTNKFVCIHGHFYQPPRENAWLEVIELQDSAAPFHDWNERINFECYAPNTAARVLDESKKIRNILNNYSYISFNFGPTLLSWMQQADPSTYQAILDADRISAARFNGHGSAMAQVYNHLIMPLANRRDKETQVIWGIRDFENRFGRKPEGMWLAETAADTETLEVLAENGIRFTVLAPRQARAIRKVDTPDWTPVSAESIDTRQPYRYMLPSGKEIALFFYHGGVSQAVAFDGLLSNGKTFAQRLLQIFDDHNQPQLAHIATDGETYGHHHRYGEMALGACLQWIEENQQANLINYGAYLEKFPPRWEAQIHENSSWSCAHGVERWRSNCGCNTGGNPGWNQAWREPLRQTLDWLRDEMIPHFERIAKPYLKDVWRARNDFIEIILDRSDDTIQAFFQKHAKKELSQDEAIRLLRSMEMQRQSQLMYTSCGWFFDEVTGIETLQILQYANRAISYTKQVAGVDLHDAFVHRLEACPSNKYPNAGEGYRQEVLPGVVDLERVGMHYAVASLFADWPEKLDIFNYTAESAVFERIVAGNQRLALGRTSIESRITRSRKHFSFAVLYLGQQNIIGDISIGMDGPTFEEMRERLTESFQQAHLSDVIGILQEYFGPEKYSLWHLFADERRKVLQDITEKSLQVMEVNFRDIYYDNYQLMSDMVQSGMDIPEAFRHAVQYIINKDLLYFFEKGQAQDVKQLQHLAGELKRWEAKISNEPSFRLRVSEWLFDELTRLDQSELSLKQLQNLIKTFEVLVEMGVPFDLWKSQNLYFSLLKGYKSGEWVFSSRAWEDAFAKLGELLNVKY